MANEPSIWDLQRQIEELRADVRAGFSNLRADAREDIGDLRNTISNLKYVDPALFEERTANLKSEIESVKTRQNKSEEKRRQDRMLLISAFLAPYIIAITVALTLRALL